MNTESKTPLEAVRGCTIQDATSRLEYCGWRLTQAIRITEGTFIMTASNSLRHLRLYGKYNRVWTANFGRRPQ